VAAERGAAFANAKGVTLFVVPCIEKMDSPLFNDIILNVAHVLTRLIEEESIQ
jgi:hypothetical protein